MNILRTVIGRLRDWNLDRLRAPRFEAPSLQWVGPLLVVATTLIG